MTMPDIIKILLFLMASMLLRENTLVESSHSAGLRFSGRMSPNSATVSHAMYEPWSWRPNATLQFFFQTSSREKALIFYQGDKGQKDQFMDFFLISGHARLRARVGKKMWNIEERVIKRDFADVKWHKVKIESTEKEILFSIDDTYASPTILFSKNDEPLLNDPLFIAGIPLEKRQWSNRELFSDVFLEDRWSLFQGCIGDIRLNRSPNGRLERARQWKSPVDVQDTCTGACAYQPCANGGRCIDKIREWECDCTGTGFEGKMCRIESKVVHMNAHNEGGYISQHLEYNSPLLSTDRNTLHFMFLTEARDGVIFYMSGIRDHLLVELVNGSIRTQADFGGGPVVVQVGNKDLSDSCWHFVEIRRRRRRLTVILDKGRNGRDTRNSSGTHLTLNLSNKSKVIYYGGGPKEALRFAQAKTISFKGFLKQFQFEELSVIDKALNNERGFSITDSNRVWQVFPINLMLKSAEEQCREETEVSGCSPSEDDSDSCKPFSTTIEGTNFEGTTMVSQPPSTLTTPKGNPPEPGTQVAAKQRDSPTPRPKGVSAWVIIIIVLAAVAVVLISIFLLYRWNHRYTGSFKPSKNEEGQPPEPGREVDEQSSRVYNQPAFFVYKPPKKTASTDQSPPVSI